MAGRRRSVVPSSDEWDRLPVDEQFALWHREEPRQAQEFQRYMKVRYFRCVAPPASGLFPGMRPAKATLRPRRVAASRH